MHCAPFDYVSATSLEEVHAALREHGDEATLIAGGQSLVPMMSLRLALPEVLIDIGGLPWEPPNVTGESITISAGTTHTAIIEDPRLATAMPLLSRVGAHIGNRRVRNRGTIGGSVAHADPAAEWPCLLVAVEASIGLAGPSGRRRVPSSDFFRGFLDTARAPDEVVVDVDIPSTDGVGLGHAQMARRANDFSVVQVVASVRGGEAGIERIRLTFGGVGQAPETTTPDEEVALAGPDLDDDLDAWLRSIVDRLDPQDDNHGPAWFRRHLALGLGRQAVASALDDRSSR